MILISYSRLISFGECFVMILYHKMSTMSTI
nr:MAG TPA: hypothetical protein [Caudoviricetes sp.]